MDDQHSEDIQHSVCSSTHGAVPLEDFNADANSIHSLEYQPADNRGWPWVDPWTGKKEPECTTMLQTPAQSSENQDVSVLTEEFLTEEEKRGILQSAFIRAASHGDIERIESMLRGKAREYIDLDGCDETGGTAIIFAACYGHQNVVEALLEAGANIHVQDKVKWSPLMWAMNNHHGNIVKLLLAHGASLDNTNVSAVEPSAIHSTSDAASHDWYNEGSTEQFEAHMEECELRRRMDMESSLGIEMDLANFGLEGDLEEGLGIKKEELIDDDFVWNKCLPEQMYVFSEDHIPCILDMVITDFEPLRSVDQKVFPADVIFLSIRFAHYYGTNDMLKKLLCGTLERVRGLMEHKPDDMAILAFWISNCMLLLYYIKKDPGLLVATIDFQLQLTELIHEIYLSFIQESKSRIEKHLDDSIIDYETISAHENVIFENEWRIFRRQKKKNTTNSYFLHEKHATPSPLLITILLSSIFFILDVYSVHPIIFNQAISQIFYWLSMELFNRVIMKKTCLSRTKAMDIRFNISVIEDWARVNSYQFENGINTKSSRLEYKSFSIYECLKNHIAPLVQLLQWLQCITSLNSIQNIETTIGTLNLLTSAQLLYVAKNYRLEVDENKIGKEIVRYLSQQVTKNMNAQKELLKRSKDKLINTSDVPNSFLSKKGLRNSNLLMNAALMLPFTLPTNIDFLVNYGSKIIEINKKKQKYFVPVIPSDFMDMLNKKINNSNSANQIEISGNAKLDNEIQNVELTKNKPLEISKDIAS
ncbi:hypothetical protein PMAC_001615 [Pneumocystis sp. 'macacae']|nr:hypothetical protein PMAC_001615 [Pneumocystis sp. 'macacae']